MSRKWKRILIIGGGILALMVVWAIIQNRNKDVIKVTTEKAAVRFITESVNASGQIYPGSGGKNQPRH